MKKRFLVFSFLLILAVFFFLFFNKDRKQIISPLSKITEKPLEKYSYENLRKKEFEKSDITIGKVLKDQDGVASYIFYFKVEVNNQNKKVSGLLNIPKEEGNYPVVVMLRGFVDKRVYTIGEGTRNSGEYLAQNGFITLAPDFLGYGESDKASNSSIEDRFQTYVMAAALLSSVKNLNFALESINSNVKADTSKIGLWGHSNGGQIALSILEITNMNYPTVLWAPVSKPFPYSVLYYTDEFDDNGKALRKVIADFEKEYNIEKYSLTNYFDLIKAPIQLHQGTDDEAVPQKWSEQLVKRLKILDKEISYFTYSGENHNFNRGSWSTAIFRTASFYRDNFELNN